MSAPKRKKIFFWRGFQLRYTCLVAGSLLILLIFSSLHGLFAMKSVLPGDVSRMVWHDLQLSAWRLFIVGMLYTVVVTLAAVFLSHRFVGPAARLEEKIRDMSGSLDKLETLHVRDGDELDGVVHALNDLIENLKKKKEL